jgi:outer membrane lipoprotein-sorting protein
MKKNLSVSILTMFLVCMAATALALEFSSDMVMTSQGQTQTSKIWSKDKKVRMESGAQPGYTIMRMDKNVMWMVMPDQKSFMEMKYDPSKQPRTDEKVQGEVSRKLIGTETVNGHPAKKYEVTYTEAGRTEKTERMYQWIATDINFPVRVAAVDGSWVVDYKNIKMSSQADSLFEVPAGYQKVAMPGSGSMSGPGSASVPGAAPGSGAAPEPGTVPAGTAAGTPEETAAQKGEGELKGLLNRIPKINLPKW